MPLTNLSTYKPDLPLTKERIASMKKEFLQLDADGDGQISAAEVETVLRSMRLRLRASEGDIKTAVKEIDRNCNGIIDMKEYLTNRRNTTNGDLIHRALVQRSRIRKLFKSFDLDSNGTITREELLQAIKERGVVSPDQIDELLREIDADNNGEIDFEEFVVLMTK